MIYKKELKEDNNIKMEKDQSILDNHACFMAPRTKETGFLWKWPDGLLGLWPWPDWGPNWAGKKTGWELNSVTVTEGRIPKQALLRDPV